MLGAKIKRSLIILLFSSALACGAAPRERDMPNNEKPYRGWADCCVLSNQQTQVVIAPAAGARVIEFSLQGTNVLLVDKNVDGQTLTGEANWMPWDGSAPDTISPDGGSQLAHIWLGRYSVIESAPGRLKCRSRDNQQAGIAMEKEFILDPKNPLLTIKRSITNLRPTAAKWSFWERTLVPGADNLAVAPVRANSNYGPNGWAGNVANSYLPGQPVDGNPLVINGLLLLRPHGQGQGIGLDADQGWTAAIVNNIFFGISFKIWPEQEYPRGQRINNIFYFADNRIELEPLSPYFEIPPGGTAEWVVVWRLFPFDPISEDKAVLTAQIRAMAARLK